MYTKGCKHSSRDLFKELQVNNFTGVLSIPQIKTGSNKTKYNKHIEMDINDSSLMSSHSSHSFDEGTNGDPEGFDNVSSIVAPNAPPTYRAECGHYKGFKSSNFINYDWTSLQEVAREKLHHPRHLEMGSCLEEEELLSILLLTGTQVGLDLIESHRKYRNYCKWRVLQTNLISALLKLKSHDRTPNSNQFFHGLLRQKKDLKNGDKSENNPLSINNIYLFNTFVSTTLDHRLIESSFHNRKDGALLFLDRREPVICADISWISKFPFEHEVLFAPCALTLPSPFESHEKKKKQQNQGIDAKKNLSPKYAKHYYNSHVSPRKGKVQIAKKNFDEDRERVSSIAEVSGYHQHQNGNKPLDRKARKKLKKQQKKERKKQKKRNKKKNKKGKHDQREERVDSLNAMGFSLVDGRLEALSVDQNDHHQFLKMRSIQSPSAATTVTSIKVETTNTIQSSEDEEQTDDEQHDDDDEQPKLLKGGAAGPTLNIINRPSADIDTNLIASFLYGKTTPEGLFLYLYRQFNIERMDNNIDQNKDAFIDEMALQSLFQSLFLFAIQIEYATRNNGVNPKHMDQYIEDIFDVARNYSNKFVQKINEQNGKYKINTDKITQEQFIDNAVFLHQLYEQFIEKIIANEMQLKYQKWDGNDEKNDNDKNNIKKGKKSHRKKSKKSKKPKGKAPTLDTGNSNSTEESTSESEESSIETEEDSYEEEQDDKHNNVHPEYKEEEDEEQEEEIGTVEIMEDNNNDEYDEESYEEEEEEEDDYEEEYYEDDEYEDDEDSTNIIQNVENIRGFCRGEISLLQLWLHFTEQDNDETNMNEKEKEDSRGVLMNYIQFDVLVYAALAYFVCERNPDSALASRRSLNPLIDQLRLSLLAAYDPDNNGYVTYNAFEYFGEYLQGEYTKLRGSLAEAGPPTPKEPQYSKQFTQESRSGFDDNASLNSVDDDENDIHEINVKGSNDEYTDTESEQDDDDDDEFLEQELEESDVIVLESLNEMEENAQNIIKYLINQIKELNDILAEQDEDDDDEEAENICNEISVKTEKLLYLTKEMEIHCNSLKNHNLRYKKAKLINYIDVKREEIQQNFHQIIHVDSD